MFGYMNEKQIVWLSVIAFIFLYCNLGSVCSHCLYNAATGWSRILGSHMRILAVALGVIGIIVAAGNVWAFFIQWLTLLGILVPPIGADHPGRPVPVAGEFGGRPAEWRVVPFIAWAAGSDRRVLRQRIRAAILDGDRRIPRGRRRLRRVAKRDRAAHPIRPIVRRPK